VPTIIYQTHDGVRQQVQAKVGQTLMEAAVRANIKGVVAECGGACSCGTCHIYLDETGIALVGPAVGDEAAILDFAPHVGPTSRLSCQIVVTDALEGLVATTPESQYG
jgi:2Fe-2S ferredoxin